MAFSLGLFRAVFEKASSTLELVTQLFTTGTTYFNYDNFTAVKETTNSNLSSGSSQTITKSWENQDGSKHLSCTTIKNALIDNIPNSTPKNMSYGFGYLQTKSSYVAMTKMFDFGSISGTTTFSAGGFHIEDISGVDYIVGYKVRNYAVNQIIVERFSTIVDLNIDPAIIVDFMDLANNTPDYSTVYDHGSDIYVAIKMNKVSPIIIPELFYFEGRQVSVNRAGNKLIFFCRVSPWPENWAVIEADDDGTSITVSLNYIHDGAATIIDPGTNSLSVSGTLDRSTLAPVNNVGDVNLPDVTSSESVSSGTYNEIVSSENSETKEFRGVTYSAIDDSILSLTKVLGTGYKRIWNRTYDYTSSTTDPYSSFVGMVTIFKGYDGSANANFSVNYSYENFDITVYKVNGVAVNNKLRKIKEMVATGTWSGGNGAGGSYNNFTSSFAKYVDTRPSLISFDVIDLSHEMFVAEIDDRNKTNVVDTAATAFAYPLGFDYSDDSSVYLFHGQNETLIDSVKGVTYSSGESISMETINPVSVSAAPSNTIDLTQPGGDITYTSSTELADVNLGVNW